jgi:hypothetical protein
LSCFSSSMLELYLAIWDGARTALYRELSRARNNAPRLLILETHFTSKANQRSTPWNRHTVESQLTSRDSFL